MINLVTEVNLILNNLKELNEDEIEEILQYIDDTQISMYKNIFLYAHEYFKQFSTFPDIDFLSSQSNFSSFIHFDDSKFSKDRLTAFLTTLKKEAISIRAQHKLYEGKFDEVKSLLLDLEKDRIVEPIFSDENIFEEYKKLTEKPAGILLGIPELDEIYKGFNFQASHVIAAPPAEGKSTTLYSIAYNAGVLKNYNVVIFSLEIISRNVLFYIISRHSHNLGTPLNNEDLIRGLLDKKGERTLKKVTDDYIKNKKGNIIVVTPNNLRTFNPASVINILDEIEEKYGKIHLVALDHLNLTGSYSTPGIKDSYQQQNFYVRFFTNLAIIRNFVMIFLSQLNRTGIGILRRGRGVDLSILAEAHELERSATTVTILQATPEMQEANQIQATTLKNRHGRIAGSPIDGIYFEPKYSIVGGSENLNSLLTPEASLQIDEGFEDYNLW